MNKNPLFSIIIPVKGRLNFTREAINSVYKQENIDNSRVEIILVENEKGRNIIRDEIKRLYPRVIISINKYEDYAGGNRNTGMEKAKGKYIVFLDSDDQLYPDFLRTMNKFLVRDKDSAAVVCLSNAIFTPGYNFKEYIKWHVLMLIRDIGLFFSLLFNKGHLFFSAFYLCQTSHMMFKKERINNIKFDYRYRRGGEDWDFINRVQYKGPIRIVPEKLTVFRYSYNSSTMLPAYRKLKWRSYHNLTYKLSPDRRKGLYYQLFKLYIKLFGGKNG